jgi:hypothetical protein
MGFEWQFVCKEAHRGYRIRGGSLVGMVEGAEKT